MRFMGVMIKLKIKELLSQKVYVSVLLLLPILVGVFGSYGMKHMEEVQLGAGIYLESESKVAIELRDLLLKDEEIQFEVYETRDDLEKAVVTSKVECGFVIEKTIEEGIHKLGDEEVITVLIAPSTIASGPIQETVGVAFFKLTTDDIALDLLKDKEYMMGVEALEEKIKTRIDEYNQGEDLLQVEFVTKGEKGVVLEADKAGVIRLCKGFIGSFLWVASMLLGVKITKERKGQIYKRLLTVGKAKGWVDYAVVIASSLCQIVVGGISLGVLCELLKVPVSVELLKEFANLIVYVLGLNSFILFISLLLKEEQVWFAMIPILSMICVLFSSMIIDLSSMQSFIKYGTWLSPAYYFIGENIGVFICLGVIGIVGYGMLGRREYSK